MKKLIGCIGLLVSVLPSNAQRSTTDFNSGWQFVVSKDTTGKQPADSGWSSVVLPHDWSITLPFDEKAPATNQGGALPGGIGWYKKRFVMPSTAKGRKTYIAFDGIYRNSEVWINGHYLGKWPYGYTSFRYELTPYLNYGRKSNELVVRVDNSKQPNSRWYSGSGIYRNVRLISTATTAIADNGVFVTTPIITKEKATVHVALQLVRSSTQYKNVQVVSYAYDAAGKQVGFASKAVVLNDTLNNVEQQLIVQQPGLWSTDKPTMYKLVTTLYWGSTAIDKYTTRFGIRYFDFDAAKGFSLNDKPLKLLGVCMHHDLGALGAAVNRAAINRQLRILKEMGCNAIRTAHNPPAPEFLDACDSMGFLVMDEAFDMWRKKKNKFDYYSDFTEWHEKDLVAMVLRDRNHPSVFMWSIGNEIREQFDSSGIRLTRELVNIVKRLDTTRPVTCALSEWDPAKNFIYQSGALDVIGLNYHQEVYKDIPKIYPGQKVLASETMSALASRGHYDMPSDSMRYWPQNKTLKFVDKGNADYTVSAYDHVAAYWGSSHEETWRIVKKHDFIAGLFVWSGFDFLGEPVPYPWPARSSYYGIVDLAGFPKDVYYMYQSEWTDKTVLHLFPHWNWEPGKVVDVWAYYNNADEVELYLNGKSLGKRQKNIDSFHVMWRVAYEPGSLVAVSRKNGVEVARKMVKTAGQPYRIILQADRKIFHADGRDLCFVTAEVVDKDGNRVPLANNKIQFFAKGNGIVKAVDNGNPAGLEPLNSNNISAYKGMALAIVEAGTKKGSLQIKATGEGLIDGKIKIELR